MRLRATQIQPINTHTHARTHNHRCITTQEKRPHTTLLIHSLKCEPLNLSHSARGRQQRHRATQTLLGTRALIYSKRIRVWCRVCVRARACAAALLNNTSFTCQNFKAQHTLRKGKGAKERWRGVGVGGLGGEERKTKIQDEQW